MSWTDPLNNETDYDKMPGHWLMARMGKRVLRPGGRELTEVMLRHLEIGTDDHVVEFAPGLGATTQLVTKQRPASYVGIELDSAAARSVATMLSGDAYRCVVADAAETGLNGDTADVVIGEALLTLQSDKKRRSILDEAHRVLRPGGRYGIHELCLRPDTLDLDTQKLIRKDLSAATRVAARPLTVSAWQELVESVGFEIKHTSTIHMGLLKPRRLIKDEGLLRSARIIFNVVRTRPAHQRLQTLHQTFRSHADHLGAMTLIATKPPT